MSIKDCIGILKKHVKYILQARIDHRFLSYFSRVHDQSSVGTNMNSGFCAASR